MVHSDLNCTQDSSQDTTIFTPEAYTNVHIVYIFRIFMLSYVIFRVTTYFKLRILDFIPLVFALIFYVNCKFSEVVTGWEK